MFSYTSSHVHYSNSHKVLIIEAIANYIMKVIWLHIVSACIIICCCD